MSEPKILELEKKLNKMHDIIAVGFSADFSITSSNWQQKSLIFDKTIKKIGNDLTLESGKVKIGAGVKVVKVSFQGLVNALANDTFYDIQIRKNSTYITSCSGRKTGDPQSWSFWISPVVIEVTEGDIIEMSAFVTSATFVANNATQFLVEIIEYED